MARVGPATSMPVKAPENYANTLNSNSQTSVSPTNPLYHVTMASKNMFTAIIKHGQNIYKHVMTAAFDPVYGREFSLAHEYERPATRFPLAETTRPNERSENVNLIALLGGSYINPNKVNPFDNTAIIYDAGNRSKKGQEKSPHQSYAGNYSVNYRKKGEEDSPTKNNTLKTSPLYKIESIAEAVEQKGREYFESFHNAHLKKDGTTQQNSNPYESRAGISAKVAYLGHKLKGYAGGVKGYNNISRVQQQTPTYKGQDTQVTTYILPTGYSGTAPQTSIDAHIAEHETIVPQDVLDATIADAEEFLRQRRIKNSDTANMSGLDSIVLK